MSKDTTLFRFDVDEDVARWLLSSLPWVTPLPPDEQETSEDSTSQPRDETAVSADSKTAGSAGAEAHLDSTATADTGQSELADIGHPTTPWPGAPMGEEKGKKKSGLVSRLGGKKVLLAAGAVLGLGVIGVAAYWLLKKRGKKSGAKGKGGKKQFSGLREKIPVIGGKSKSTSEPKSTSSTKRSSEDESESRSYPMDISPVVGMGFLALGTVLLRRFRREKES